MITDGLVDCQVVQMRCIGVADSDSTGNDYHRAFWRDEQCSVELPAIDSPSV
jgi:hypothetical protein